MNIRKLRAGRVPSVTAEQYIGERGSIFWDEDTGNLRLSDGITLGGSPLPITLATTSTAGSLKPGAGFTIGAGGLLSLNAGPMFELDDNEVFQLKPGTADRIGGIKPGPGVTIDSSGTLLIDTSGLPFSFGDFVASTPGDGAATLSSVGESQDIAIVSNGTGSIDIVGDFHIHRTVDYDPDNINHENAVFAVKSDGQIQMKIPLADVTAGALEIVGNDSGLFMPPNQTGVILHVTGNSGLVSRNYFDASANYALLAGRRYNGTQLAPTKVLSGEMFFRIAGQAATQSGSDPAVFQTFGPAQIDWVATEDQGPTNQGGELRFRATPNGVSAQTGGIIVATINATTGVTATQFNTAAQVSARNYNGQARNAGTLGAAGTLTIDFATDHNVLVNLTTTATIAFSNITAGKTVTVLVKNDTGVNRAVTTGVVEGNTSGGNAAPNVNDGRTGVLVYRTFGTASTDVYCEFNP